MTKPTQLSHLLLIASAAAMAGCSSPDSQAPVANAPVADRTPVQAATPAPAPAATTATSDVSRERVLRAITCQIVLSQALGTKMANADTGLPADLESRLKVSAAARWDTFAVEHAPAAGVTDEDRLALIVSFNQLSPTAEERQHTVDTVRDCLDNDP